jgi:hypothetical protein
MAAARSRVLIVDALINLVLGLALLSFRLTAHWLGIPDSTSAFYPMILGGVLFGIGVALLWETVRGEAQSVGLGLAGAVAINLSGGLVLTMWLLLGDLDLPLRGKVILWVLAGVLVSISFAELVIRAERREDR